MLLFTIAQNKKQNQSPKNIINAPRDGNVFQSPDGALCIAARRLDVSAAAVNAAFAHVRMPERPLVNGKHHSCKIIVTSCIKKAKLKTLALHYRG